MPGTERGSGRQAEEGRDPMVWHGAQAAVNGSALEVPAEMDLLPDFEALLRGDAWEDWCVPGPEGLMG